MVRCQLVVGSSSDQVSAFRMWPDSGCHVWMVSEMDRWPGGPWQAEAEAQWSVGQQQAVAEEPSSAQRPVVVAP